AASAPAPAPAPPSVPAPDLSRVEALESIAKSILQKIQAAEERLDALEAMPKTSSPAVTGGGPLPEIRRTPPKAPRGGVQKPTHTFGSNQHRHPSKRSLCQNVEISQ